MKYKLTSFLISALFLAGCADDESFDMVQVREIRATLNGFKSEEAETRTAYNISETSGFQTLWAAGDVLGIYPIGGDQVTFPISDGVGTTTAKFDGGSWALRGTYKYAAYYPFSADCYSIDQTAIPVSFGGQTQNGNNSMSHLAAVDFMAAAGTQPSENGSVNLQFNHVGCFLRMQFTMPQAATFTEVSISATGATFTTQGTVNLAATTPSLTPTASSSKLLLKLKNISTTAANQTITLYMMVAPDDLLGKTLTFTVKDNKGNQYSKTAAGKKMVATYAYNYPFTLEVSGTGGSTSGGGWGESPDANGHAYVDLGLPSGTLWATCNVGATNSDEVGEYYAWGERKPKNDVYRFTTYKYSKSVITGQFGLTVSATLAKYCTGLYPGDVDYKTELEHQDDAAAINWGGDWRMPTVEEFRELLNECECHHISYDNGVIGYLFTSKSNGKTIFLPAAGRKHNGLSYYHSIEYWTSSLSEYQDNYAQAFVGWGITDDYRSRGCLIRPVLPSQVYRQPHDYVDLGLKDENGQTLYWATCNVGADKPEEYGLYFAWGETTGYTSDEKDGRSFDWPSYLLAKDHWECSEYGDVYNSDGNYDGRRVLSLEDDAAHVNWGGNWRMPTKSERDALFAQCSWTWTSLNGVNGYRVVAPNGNSIFLPAAGYYFWEKYGGANGIGVYWSSVCMTNHAYGLGFTSRHLGGDLEYYTRCWGLPVRAVCVLP